MSKAIRNQHGQSDFYGVCSACRLGCCNEAKPPLSYRRMRVIESFMKTNRLRIGNPFEIRDYAFPRETRDGYCVFYDRSQKKCTIHPVKPETCVAGPITFDINPKTRKIEWFLKKDSICPLAGPLYQNKEAFNDHLKSARREIRRLVRDMGEKALHAILAIQEPDTIKIGEDRLELSVLEKLWSLHLPPSKSHTNTRAH